MRLLHCLHPCGRLLPKRPRRDGPSTEARLTGLLGIQQGIESLVEGLLEAPMTRGGENGTMVTMSPDGTAIERENLQAFPLVHGFEQGHVRRQSSPPPASLA